MKSQTSLFWPLAFTAILAIVVGCQNSSKESVSKNNTPVDSSTAISNPATASTASANLSLEDRIPGLPTTNSKHADAKKPATREDLEKFFDQFKSPTQYFVLKTANDTLIVGEQGTRVHVRMDDFVTENNNQVMGPVTVSLVECYSPLEMFAHQLSTHTVDKRVLETGGSVQILAKAGGQNLKFKPGKAMQVEFPVKSEYQEGMEEFVGVKKADGVVEWQAGNATETTTIVPEIGVSSPELLGDSIANAPNIPVNFFYGRKMGNSMSFMDLKSVGKSGLNLALQPTTQKDRFFGDFMHSISVTETNIERVLSKQNESVVIGVIFNRNGKIKRVTSQDYMVSSVKRELTSKLKRLPAIVMKGVKPNKIYLLSVSLRRIQQDPISYGTADPSKLSPAELKLNEVYNLNVTWLGWVNCDRYMKDKRPKVNIGAKLGLAATVFLICKKIKSRMFPGVGPDGVFTFYNLPIDEPVRLVAVRVDGDNFYLETKDFEVYNQNEPFTFDPKTQTTKEGIVEAFKL